MSIETYLVLPAAQPKRLGLADDPDVCHVGADFFVLLHNVLFATVQSDPGLWGPRLLDTLSGARKRGLDPRGLLVVPEVGQAFPERYAELADAEGAIWLPTKRRRTSQEKRLLLVGLAAKDERFVLAKPEVVAGLVEARGKRSIPCSLELGPEWFEIQRALLEVAAGDGTDDTIADALTPRSGLSYFESRVVDRARLVEAARVARASVWFERLAPDLISSCYARGLHSDAARDFPGQIGSSEAEDAAPLRAGGSGTSNRPTRAQLRQCDVGFMAVRAFYRALAAEGKAALSIRFRGAPRPSSQE